MRRRHRRVTLPGKLVRDGVVDAPPVDPAPSPAVTEVINARFPVLRALLATIAEDDDRERARVEARTAVRHWPVFDHGRNSAEMAEWPDGCPDPPGWCDHASRDLVCGSCRDYVGEPLPAPCPELVDQCARYRIDLA